jgi:tRNA threonylcarbamoyladenosine biosynthesis protein TsaB
MAEMKILALDTATEACSVALLLGDTLIGHYEEPRHGHAELILPMVDALLNEAHVTLRELDCLAVGRGPGSFTGVRIAVSVAQGLAFGAGLKVVPISDLAALAQRAAVEHRARNVLACMDARIGEVYWGAFEAQSAGLVEPTTPERVSSPDALEAPPGTEWFGAGSGWSAHPGLTERLRAAGVNLAGVDASLLPRAQEVARLAARDFTLGRAVPPEQALPVYLRDQVATTSRKSQT